MIVTWGSFYRKWMLESIPNGRILLTAVPSTGDTDFSGTL
jgi:hypothetical protein